ncbi:baseplate J/gp47 family protein [Halorubellus litoreus]|uniref:Baseplate J/gp47 family protein n=1 Tax=Halorubellus litoreus TaxID=755308 RepID=A0ABD5VE36_9EURY
MQDGDESIIRAVYEPVAVRFAEIQNDLGLVLDSAQLDHAEGLALDFLTALIGVRRQDAVVATGSARFSRGAAAGVDYTIPKGTTVQTDSDTPVRFVTTTSATLLSGNTEVDVAIKAVEGGVLGNVGANTLVVMPSAPSGIEAVTNPAETTGGVDEEADDELRARAEEQLSEGSAATPNSIITAIQNISGVKDVTYFGNNQDVTDADGLPPHSGEFVVQGGDGQTIAQKIADKKAWGDTLASGVHGSSDGPFTVTYINGQTDEFSISRPTEVQIYVDMDIEVTDEFAGTDSVRDAIVAYTGGLMSTGSTIEGDIGVGDDVIFGEIQYAIRSVDGVYDITALTVDTVDPPTGTANLAIGDGSVATADSNDDSITLTTTVVSP